MKIFLTGSAGFIGYHSAKRLLNEGHEIFGFDSINSYYDPSIKYSRLKQLENYPNFRFAQGKLEEAGLEPIFKSFKPTHVLHLAAQAGVRYSIENPMAYIDANIVGFQNIIELIRSHPVKNFVFASSSSVYGGNISYPFSENQKIDNPISLYAATKMSNELVSKAYSNLYKIPSTALRFFTVYGPFSRPDMAIFKFAKLISEGSEIPIYNNGNMYRDFTYIDDIVDGIIATLNSPAYFRVYNLGAGKPEKLLDMITYLETELNIAAKRTFHPMQLGDVPKTAADITKARAELGYEPKINLQTGIKKFVDWFKKYHSSNTFDFSASATANINQKIDVPTPQT